MTDILNHLLTRRSVSAKHLKEPGPSPEQLETILTAGARVPDHGKMAPFYFITFQGDERNNDGRFLKEAYENENPGTPPAKLDLEAERFLRSPLIEAVVSRIRNGKHPQWEQILTAGAACMNICHAAHALGFKANWLTEWYAYNPHFKKSLGLDEARDNVAGFIYIGTPDKEKDERERPDLNDIWTDWSPDCDIKKGEGLYGKDKYGLPRKGFDLSD